MEFFKHWLFKLILIIVLSLTLIILYARYIGTKRFEVREYRVESNVLTENFSGLKVIHFSDLLYGSTVELKDVNNMVSRINILKPDLVLFTGDLISTEYKMSDTDREKLIESLSKIDASIGKYAIYGDADYKIKTYESIMSKSGFKVLDNSYDVIYYKDNNPLYIVGFPSSIKEKINLEKSFEFYSDENRHYTIVMAHEGKSIKYLDDSTYEVDLILGGHSLNGSIRLPFIGGILTPEDCYKYSNEYYEKGITNIYISGGMGTNEYKFRLNNKPSINLYRLKAQS